MNFHGGDIYKYSDKQIIDFSSNINPLGVPESFKKSLVHNLDLLTKYPDINYLDLRKAIAHYLGTVCAENIVVGNGAVEIIYKATASLDIDKVIIATPTFSEYKRATKIRNIPCEEVSAYLEDGAPYLGNIYDKISKNNLVVLCNPNNPTGTLVNLESISLLAKKLLNNQGYLLLDEAFIEFTPGFNKNSMINKLNKYPNIIVVRAITKFFGMPGIRLGYGVCSNLEVIDNIKEKLEPWNINTAAVIAGLTVLTDDKYIMESRKWIEDERHYLFKMLSRLKGITVMPTSTNFMLIKVKGYTPWEMKKILLQRDILIRTPEGFTGIFPGYFRIAIKDKDSNEKLLAALEEVLNL